MDNGILSDDIGSLMHCRDLLAGEIAYFSESAISSLEQMKMQDAYYRQQRTILVESESVKAKGQLKADKATPDIKKNFIAAEVLYTRIRFHLKYLEMRDDITKQKLSHLKNLWELNKFQNQ
jgi:hypothetical protein